MMATMHDTAPARKKVTTYGKAARRRIPEYSFSAAARKSQTPEVVKRADAQAATSTITVETPTKLKAVPRRSVSRTPSSASPPPSVYDMLVSEDEAPKPINRPTATPSKLKSRSTSSTPPSPAKAVDVFDILTSDDDAPRRRTTPRPSKIPPGKNAALKTINQKTAPSSPPKPAARTIPDVFDILSSDEEATSVKSKPASRIVRKSTAVHNLQQKITLKTSADAAEEVSSRKRLKLSPAPGLPSPRRVPLDTSTIPRRPKPLAKPETANRPAKPLKGRLNSPKNGQFTKPAIRPRSQSPLKPAKQPVTLKKISSPEPSTPSTQQADIDMMDVDPEHEHISPKGMKMWKALLDPAEDVEMTIEAARDEPSRKKPSGLLSRPAGVFKAPQRSPKRLPRRRLIDCLVEQAAQEESEDESSEDEDSQSSIDSGSSSSQAAPQIVSRGQSLVPEAPNSQPIPSDSQSSQATGPKFTYAKQRSMLVEADLMAQLAIEMPVPPPQSSQGRRARMATVPPTLKSLSSLHNDEDEDGTTPDVKSVHELRKLGNTNRFLDEMQDFLDRIGSPGKSSSSTRRSGLLDLASKMQDKAFAEKFRANGMEQRLFLHLGQEADIVAGFIMVSLLTSVLFDGNMSHIVVQLRRQGITRLLIRLLECQSDIAVLAKDRKSNMSKVAQSLLIEYVADIVKMPAWEDLKPPVLSPRTAALRCIDVMVRQTRDAGNDGEIFSKELNVNLFEIMKTASNERSWDLPKERRALDLLLAVSALEAHSLAARTALNESIWISDFLPIVANTLEIALSQPVEEFGPTQVFLFRLVLNVTNNNSKASDVFARPGLISLICRVIVAKWNQISRFMVEEKVFPAIDTLVTLEGMMISFAEWSAAARESIQSLAGRDDDPLDALLQIFADNKDKISEVTYSPSYLFNDP
jgi:hypothetical protein